MPKVSVIVPCYNMEKYVERCLDSLQKQLMEDIEIICIDDKSSDKTLEILNARAKSDPRIRVIAQEKNMGVAVARNTGIENATGEYIGFVDADDYIDIDFYQKLYNHAVRTDAEITKGLLTIIENGKRWIPPTNEHVKVGKICFCYDFTSAIYKTEFLNKNNLRFMTGVSLGEDITFLITASHKANAVEICPYSTSYYYLIRQGSANTTMGRDKVDSIVRIVEYMMNYANNTPKMSDHDYNFIIWFLMDVLMKNLAKAKHEDKGTLEQSVFYVIKNAKDTKFAKETLCQVFSQQSSRLLNKYVPHKLFLKYIKKCNVNVYNFYARQILLKKRKLGGMITVTETPSFTVVRLFDKITLYKKYMGKQPIKIGNNSVEFLPGQPKVSIIVPVHNVEKYVGQCLESLTKQTMQEVEIICIDDCGKDNSMQIVEQFAQRDKRIKIIKNKKNCGLSYSRNVGIKNATAPYILFCDSDDMLALDACEKMVATITQQNADIAACSMKIIYEANQDLQASDNYLKVTQNGTFDMNKQVQVSCNVCGPAKLYKRKIVQEHGIEFPVGLRHEDEFFYPAYCIWAKRIAFTSEELYQYRRRVNSIMNSVYKRDTLNLDPMKVTMQYMKYCKKHGVWEREKLWFWDVMFPGMFNASLRHSGQRNAKPCFDFARRCIKKYFSPRNMPTIVQRKIMSIKNTKL